MFDEAFVEHTIACWQPYFKHPLTQEDALIIIERFGALLDLLERWAREDGEVLYQDFMFWSGYGEDEMWFEAKNSLWTRLIIPYNVVHDTEDPTDTQSVLDDQAGRRVHRRHDDHAADVG